MSPLRRRFLALVLALLGAYAWWLTTGIEHQNEVTEQTGERRPDYTVGEFTATMMDESGAPHRRLTAAQLRHYPDDESTELEQPLLTVFTQTAPPWLIRSETGWVSADGAEVILRGKVVIDREPGAVTRSLHLRTPELVVKPRLEYAETERPVVATSGADWLTSAEGARVWFGDFTRIELEGRARAQFSVDQESDGNQSAGLEEP